MKDRKTMIEYPILKSILTEDFAEFTSCVPCQQDCGLNYCSIRCRDLDFFESHNYTCVGPHNDDHPLVMFKENAIDYADTFFGGSGDRVHCKQGFEIGR